MCMCMCPQALELDPTNESYRANLTTVEEQLRVPNPAAAPGPPPGPPPSGGGEVGGAEGGADPSAGLGGKFGGGKWVGLQSVISGWCQCCYICCCCCCCCCRCRCCPGLLGMVQNPGFMNMAANLIQTPAFQNMYVCMCGLALFWSHVTTPPPPRDVYGSHQVPVW